MDVEPSVPTPEKGGASLAQPETLSGFKRNLFTAPDVWEVQRDARPDAERSSKQSFDVGKYQKEVRGDDLRRIETSKGSAECRSGKSVVQPVSKQQADSSYCSPKSKRRADEQAEESGHTASVQQSKHSKEQEGPGRVSSSTAGPPSDADTDALHTPLKVKKPGSTYGIFTPPAAPATRRSIASSPITPLPNGTQEASRRRIPNKKSAKLKGLSLQLDSADQDAPACSSSTIQGGPTDTSANTRSDSPAPPHPYALLASSHPAEELMGDPKYRGMAALGCQHQYTEADRASFLRRREIIARDLNSAIC